MAARNLERAQEFAKRLILQRHMDRRKIWQKMMILVIIKKPFCTYNLNALSGLVIERSPGVWKV